MRRLIEGWRRVRSLRRRNELETGLDEEIRFHIDRQTEKNLRAGMAADEARRLALIKFGGVDTPKRVLATSSALPPLKTSFAISAMEGVHYCALRVSRSSPR